MLGQLVSHYRIEEELGRGTYGVVYRASHSQVGAIRVAVKVVHPQLSNDASFISALQRECGILHVLQHPNIVGFRDLVQQQGCVAMVLELLEGRDFHEVLEDGPQSVSTVVDVVAALLSALAFAHDNGVVHRDIKPSNVFRCDDGRIKLLDFGVSQAAQGTTATQSGQIVGTFDYMAPERFRGMAPPASDIYAVGLVAWELLTGRPACPPGDYPAKIGWHLGVGAGDVRAVVSECPDWLAGFIGELTALDHEHRPRDGAAALHRLETVRPAVSSTTTHRPGGGTAGARQRPDTVAMYAEQVPKPVAPSPAETPSCRVAPSTVTLPTSTVAAVASPTSSPARRVAPSTVSLAKSSADSTMAAPAAGPSTPPGPVSQPPGSVSQPPGPVSQSKTQTRQIGSDPVGRPTVPVDASDDPVEEEEVDDLLVGMARARAQNQELAVAGALVVVGGLSFAFGGSAAGLALVGIGGLGSVVVAVQLVRGLRFAPVLGVAPVGLAVLGPLAVARGGVAEALERAASVSPGRWARVACAGLGASLEDGFWLALVGSGAGGLVLIAAVVAGLRGGDRKTSTTLVGLGVTSLATLTVWGTVLVDFQKFGPWSLVLAVGLPVLGGVGSLAQGSRGATGNGPEAGAIAAPVLVLAVAMLASCGLFSSGEMVFRAVGSASLETRDILMAAGLSVVALERLVGWMAVGLMLPLAGLGVSALAETRRAGRRGAVLSVVVALLAPLLLVSTDVSSRVLRGGNEAWERLIPPPSDDLQAPVSTARKGVLPATVVHIRRKSEDRWVIDVDGRRADEPDALVRALQAAASVLDSDLAADRDRLLGGDDGERKTLLIHADRNVPWSRVVAVVKSGQMAGFNRPQLVVYGVDVGQAVIDLRPPVRPTTDVELRVQPSGFTLGAGGGMEETVPTDLGKLDQLTAIAHLIKDELPDNEAVVVWAEDDVLLSTVVRGLDAVREDYTARGPGGSGRMLFPLVVVGG